MNFIIKSVILMGLLSIILEFYYLGLIKFLKLKLMRMFQKFFHFLLGQIVVPVDMVDVKH